MNSHYQPFDNFQNPNTPINPGVNPAPFGEQPSLQTHIEYPNYNSKIFINPNEQVPQYELFRGSNDQQACFQDSLSSILELSSVAKAYFSKPNVDRVQELIISRVFQLSNGEFRIGRQSDLQLQIIMRSIYLSYGKNAPTRIKEQVDELNQYVVDEAMNTIMPNIRQYLSYREEISTPRKFFDWPINPSSKGEKTFSLLNV